MDESHRCQALEIAGRNKPLREGLEELFARPSRDAILNKVARCRGIGARREKVAEVVARYLDHDNWEVRQGAVVGLGDLNATNQIAAVGKRLDDPHPRVRANAVTTLGELGAHGSLDRIATRLADTDPSVRRAALSVLSTCKATADVVVPFLRHEDPAVRAVAVETLGHLRHRTHAEHVAELLADLDAAVRARALTALSCLGAEKHLEAVFKLFEDADYLVRRAAWDVLPGNDPRVIDRARQLLDHPDAAIQLHAARNLRTEFLPMSVVPRVAMMLDHPDERLALDAALIVESLAKAHWPRVGTRGDYPEVVQGAREWWEAHRNDARWRN